MGLTSRAIAVAGMDSSNPHMEGINNKGMGVDTRNRDMEAVIPRRRGMEGTDLQDQGTAADMGNHHPEGVVV